MSTSQIQNFLIMTEEEPSIFEVIDILEDKIEILLDMTPKYLKETRSRKIYY